MCEFYKFKSENYRLMCKRFTDMKCGKLTHLNLKKKIKLKSVNVALI